MNTNYQNLQSLGFETVQLNYLDEKDGTRDQSISDSIFNRIIVEYAEEHKDEVDTNPLLMECLSNIKNGFEKYSTSVSKTLYNYVKSLTNHQTDEKVPAEINAKMTEILKSISDNLKKLNGAPNGNCFAPATNLPDGVTITRIETSYKYTDDSNDDTYYNLIDQSGSTVQRSDSVTLKMTYEYNNHTYEIEHPVDYVLESDGHLYPYHREEGEKIAQ